MTFKRSSILDGFREYGLVFYNSNIVLNKIQEYQPSLSRNRPFTSLTIEIWSPTTSLTVRSLKK